MKKCICICSVTILAILCATTAMAQKADLRTTPALTSGSKVRLENRFFDITPRIVRANQEATVTITPMFDHRKFDPACTYELVYTPTERYALQSGWQPETKTLIEPVDGKYQFKMFFEGEQEHVLYIEQISKDNKRRVFGDIRLYSLNDDLFSLRPYKGDFHIHSNRSDGIESPAYVAGACRRVGFDWMGLSDHEAYGPSVESQKAFTGLPIDLKIYNAEEVHCPDNPVHVLSFGATGSVSAEYFNQDKYRREVAKIQENLPPLAEGVNKFEYAANLWEVAKIHEKGGMAMFCHPYWYTRHMYPPGGALTTALLENGVFDALEVISGMGSETLSRVDTNNLQIARWHDERAAGRRIGICGISDAHGVESSDNFGRYYTVAFAPKNELADIIAAIKEMNSVVVEAVAGHQPRAHGSFRLVKFASYLLLEVFPQHDDMCYEEGRQMIQYAAGNTSAADRLKLMHGQVDRLYGKYWAK